jgi:cytochrome c553
MTMLRESHSSNLPPGELTKVPSHRKQGRSAMNKFALLALSTIALSSSALGATGDAARGERDFRVCASCHSLEA